MEALCSHLNLLIWLDDMLGCPEDADALIDVLKSLLAICRDKCLKLNPRKCNLNTKKLQFFCRMIGAKGVTFHPRKYEALTSTEAPTTVGALPAII